MNQHLFRRVPGQNEASGAPEVELSFLICSTRPSRIMPARGKGSPSSSRRIFALVVNPVRLVNAPANRGVQTRRRSVAQTRSCGVRPQLPRRRQLPAIGFLLHGWRRHTAALILLRPAWSGPDFLKENCKEQTRKIKKRSHTHMGRSNLIRSSEIRRRRYPARSNRASRSGKLRDLKTQRVGEILAEKLLK